MGWREGAWRHSIQARATLLCECSSPQLEKVKSFSLHPAPLKPTNSLDWVGHRPLAKNIKEIEAQHPPSPRSLARRHSLFSGCRQGKSASADI